MPKTVTTPLEREIQWLRFAIKQAEKPGEIVYCDLDGMKQTLKYMEAENAKAN